MQVQGQFALCNVTQRLFKIHGSNVQRRIWKAWKSIANWLSWNISGSKRIWDLTFHPILAGSLRINALHNFQDFRLGDSMEMLFYCGEIFGSSIKNLGWIGGTGLLLKVCCPLSDSCKTLYQMRISRNSQCLVGHHLA
jgi:hypothetical protein